MPNKLKIKARGWRACHGCGGMGWVVVNHPAHWKAGGAPDVKLEKIWVPAQPVPVLCPVCGGEGAVKDMNGFKRVGQCDECPYLKAGGLAKAKP